MIYKKVFNKSITISDVNNIYNPNINNLLLDILKDTFENKCYKSCFILKVNNIINRSDINFNNKDLEASVNVSVQFEADILYYDMYDIITNVSITAITDHKIICQHKNASIFIQYENKLKSYKENQIIPIKVGICKYYLGENKVSINAFPFIPLKAEIENEVYYNIPKLSNEDIEELNKSSIINDIRLAEDEMLDIKKKQNNRWDYFNDLLYPFKTEKKKNKNISEIDLLDFGKLDKDNNIIAVLPQYNITNKKLLLVSNNKIMQKKIGDIDNPIDQNPITILSTILIKYYKHIKTINELSIIYHSDDKFNEHINIFDTYRTNKI